LAVDQDFCVVPLSGDVASNPFRNQKAALAGSQSLLHAILAVSCYHAGRQASNDDYPPSDVIDHQQTAVKLYRDELDACAGSPGVSLLDTTMIFFLYNVSSWMSLFVQVATNIIQGNTRRLQQLGRSHLRGWKASPNVWWSRSFGEQSKTPSSSGHALVVCLFSASGNAQTNYTQGGTRLLPCYHGRDVYCHLCTSKLFQL